MSRDYVIGVFLPTLFDSAKDYAEKVYEFTKAEAEQLRFAGLPLRINHNGDDEFVVGRVEAAYIHPGTREATALLSIEHDYRSADNVHERIFASNAVASGMYAGLSLGHDFAAKRSTAGPRRLFTEKTPLEISLCRKGARPDTHITHFFPCKETLERLHSNGKLEETLARYQLGGIVEKSVARSESYITDLARQVAKKCAETVLKHNFDLSARTNHLRTVRVMASQQQQSAAPPADEAMEVDRPAEPEQQSSAVATPSSAPTPPAQQASVTTELVTPETDKIKLLEQFERQQREHLAKQAEMQAELARFKQREEERNRREEAQKSDEIERKRREGQTFLDTVRDVMRRDLSYTPAEVTEQTQSLEQQLQTNPLAAAEQLRTMARVMVQSSNKLVERSRKELEMQQMRAAVSNQDRATIEELTRRINANHASSMMFNAPTFGSAPLGGGLQSRLEMAAPEPPVQTGTYNASANAASSSSAMQTPAQSTSAPEVDPNNPRALFDTIRKSENRLPTYAELAMGGVVEMRTGRRLAAANNTTVDEIERRPRFGEPRHFGFQDFVADGEAIIAACAAKYKRSDALRMDALARRENPAAFR